MSGAIGALIGWWVPNNPTPLESAVLALAGAAGGVLIS